MKNLILTLLISVAGVCAAQNIHDFEMSEVDAIQHDLLVQFKEETLIKSIDRRIVRAVIKAPISTKAVIAEWNALSFVSLAEVNGSFGNIPNVDHDLLIGFKDDFTVRALDKKLFRFLILSSRSPKEIINELQKLSFIAIVEENSPIH
jgi:hypothetical protein